MNAKWLDQFFEPAIKKTIEFININHYEVIYYYFVFLIIFILLIGFLINWFFSTRKLKSENIRLHSDIKKLDIEAKIKKLELVEKIQVYRKKCIENAQLFTISSNEVLIALKERNANQLAIKLEELYDFFFNTLLSSFFEYFEIIEIYYEDEKAKRLCFIDEDVFRIFKTMNYFLSLVNHETILRETDRKKTTISEETVSSLIRFIKVNIHWYDFERKSKLKDYMLKFGITKSGKALFYSKKIWRYLNLLHV